MTKHLLVFLGLLVLISLRSTGQEEIKPRTIEIKVSDRFSDVTFWGQTNLYGVKFILGTQKNNKPLQKPDPDALGMQVWLLQPDGTAIPQLAEPGIYWTGRFDSIDCCMSFTFTRFPTNTAIGVVVRYRNQLYTKEIKN